MRRNGDTGNPASALARARECGNRDKVLALLEDLIHQAHEKAANGRVHDPENERVRQGWFKTVGYLAGQYRQLVRDRDLEEMQADLANLKETLGVDP